MAHAPIPKALKVNIASLDGFGTTEVLAKFDYDRGEPQWFDARVGYGSPGYPASVEVTSIFIGGVEIDPAILSSETLERIEEQLIEKITEIESLGRED